MGGDILHRFFTERNKVAPKLWNIIIHTLIKNDCLDDWSPEKSCCWQLTFQQPAWKPSSESSDGFSQKNYH